MRRPHRPRPLTIEGLHVPLGNDSRGTRKILVERLLRIPNKNDHLGVPKRIQEPDAPHAWRPDNDWIFEPHLKRALPWRPLVELPEQSQMRRLVVTIRFQDGREPLAIRRAIKHKDRILELLAERPPHVATRNRYPHSRDIPRATRLWTP